jgi:uncharacterized membrane protein YhdT
MSLPYVNRRENQLQLVGRMPTLHWPRFRPSEAESTGFAWWCMANSLYVAGITLGLDAFRALLLVPFAAFIPDILRWIARYSSGSWYFPKLRFLVLPFTTVWLVGIMIPVAADHVGAPLWFGAVVGILVWRMIRVGQKVRTHYLDYCLEHEALSEATRTKWKRCRDSGWSEGGVDPSPAAPLSSLAEQKRFKEAVYDIRWAAGFDWMLVIAGIVVGLFAMKVFAGLLGSPLRGNGSMMMMGLAIIGICAIPAALRLGKVSSAKEELDGVWHALHVFCHSPPTVPLGSRAPWSVRSRYGDAENRRGYLLWNVVLIGFLLISAVVLYPLIGGMAPGDTNPSYPIAGSMAAGRLLLLRFDTTTPGWVLCAYFAATFLATPIFFGSGLVALVGPSAAGGRNLFERDDALEHERQVFNSSTSGPTAP